MSTLRSLLLGAAATFVATAALSAQAARLRLMLSDLP